MHFVLKYRGFNKMTYCTLFNKCSTLFTILIYLRNFKLMLVCVSFGTSRSGGIICIEYCKYSSDQTESYLRNFLGRMLFSGDSVFKEVQVLSGGEKVRCMFSRMMLFGSNALILDQPTNHLDLESITAVNNGLSDFKGNILFSSHDYEIVNTVANRIIEITPDGWQDFHGTYEEFVEAQKKKGITNISL